MPRSTTFVVTVRGALLVAFGGTMACATLFGIDAPVVDEGVQPDGETEAGLDALVGGGLDATDTMAFDAAGDAGPPDADGDAEPSRCDPKAPFGPATIIAELASAKYERKPRLMPNERTLYYGTVLDTDGGFQQDIYVATRTTRSGQFGTPALITSVDTTIYGENDPTLPPDGTVLIFASNRPGTGTFDLWEATGVAFTNLTELVGVNSKGIEGAPFLASAELWFTSDRTGRYELYRSLIDAGAFGPPTTPPELSSGEEEFAPVITSDLLTIYFGSRRTVGSLGRNDVWRAHRATTSASFTNVENVLELNTTADDNPAWISPDECRIYMDSDRDGPAGLGYHMYVAERDH